VLNGSSFATFGIPRGRSGSKRLNRTTARNTAGSREDHWWEGGERFTDEAFANVAGRQSECVFG
jgi:hypothetical protein